MDDQKKILVVRKRDIYQKDRWIARKTDKLLEREMED
jgi:hypothetical protein